MLTSLCSAIANYILPYRCISCSKLTQEQNGICMDCFQKINFISSPYCKICCFPFEFIIENQLVCANCIAKPPKYDLARTLLKFDQYSKNLIHAFKYNDKTIYAKMFAKLLAIRYKEEFRNVDLITPVPMHRWKRVIRNYNPAQILAKEIALYFHQLMLPDLLIKTKWTKTQTSLTRAKRQKNIIGSIKVNTKYNIKDKTILLVDDVKTTGATSNTISQLLKKAGAKKIILATIGLT